MRYCRYCIAALTALVVAANSTTAASFEIWKLLAFSGTNQVRAECELRSDSELTGVELSAEVTRAGTRATLWKGSLGNVSLRQGSSAVASHVISGLQPELWSPVSPALYWLKVTAQQSGKTLADRSVRFGFRSFEAREGQFHLNGGPIFLRGIAINPPGRGIPDSVGESRQFAEDYVRFLKGQNVNIFRLSTDGSQTWFDVCDELGMMLYAGRYGALPGAPGKTGAPADVAGSIAAYKKLFEGYVSHPSIVEYYLSNELPRSGARGAAFSKFLTRACAELKRWDPTRAYIGNAGYGEGREGDVCDVHRYWGWYYNSFLTYYNLRDILYPTPLYGDPMKNQPLTFTECVGAFTSSSGEFNLVRSKQLAPSLGWIGHTETPREDALAYQSFITRQACESFRRMRPLNPRLAGLMPFTILFSNWSGISKFDEMKAKPVADALRMAYQPILLSWELWTPQVYAGTEIQPVIHVINDDDEKRELRDAKVDYRLHPRSADASVRAKTFGVSGSIGLPPIPYFGTWSKCISIKLPADLPTGQYILSGTIRRGENRESTPPASTNFTTLFIAGADWKESTSRSRTIHEPRAIHLFDPSGQTAGALRKLGMSFELLMNLNGFPADARTLVIGEAAPIERGTALQSFIRSGGRVLCLRPNADTFDASWLPQKVTFFTSSPNDPTYPPRSRPFREQMNVNLERTDHPVFAGLNRSHFSLWSDYSNWDQSKPGFPQIYPVTGGFKLDDSGALEHTAVLADYDRGLEGIALCEFFDGEGSIVLSGFDLVSRIGLDPIADRLLANLIAYTASKSRHEVFPLVDKAIQWGNYPTERGVVCGSLNGLLVNAEWLPSSIRPNSTSLAPNTGAWNMLPGEQFEPRGRNPFGPYGYSTASSLKDLAPDAKTGEGFFWARIPPGRKFVATIVKNPAPASSTIKVRVNDDPTAVTETVVAAGQTMEVQTPIPRGVTNVCIRYAGEKTLVLLETEFD